MLSGKAPDGQKKILALHGTHEKATFLPGGESNLSKLGITVRYFGEFYTEIAGYFCF
jgi:hypothetical protein